MFAFLQKVNSVLWSGPLLVLLLGTHIILTVRSGFIQKKVIKGIKLSLRGPDSFAILATTLAATLGTGNIIGVSTAIALGGPGALFWCWVTGIIGMATTYYEGFFGAKYKTKAGGGPMYIMKNIMKLPMPAYIYAFFMLFVCLGTGCLTQSNAVADSFLTTFHINPIVTGFIVAIISGLVIIGGKSSIIEVCTKIVPIMCGMFLLGCVYLLIINRNYIPQSIALVFEKAFEVKSGVCGIMGGTMMAAARYGIARGLFTNEAGLGSASVFAGAGGNDPYNQGLISMTATFWDTVVICAVTGLVIISSYLADPSVIEGYSIGGYMTAAFGAIPCIGRIILSAAIFGFAVSTIIGWFFIGEQAAQFLFGKYYEAVIPAVRVVYIVMVFLGAAFSLDIIWETADIFNVFLIIPNVYMLLRISD